MNREETLSTCESGLTTSSVGDVGDALTNTAAGSSGTTPLSSPFRSSREVRFGDHRPPVHNKHPLTIFIRHKIVPGKEALFEEWVMEIGRLLRCFTGFLDAEIIRPNCCESHEYVSVVRFDTYDNLQVWMDSSERQLHIDKAYAFSEEPMKVSYHSLEYWFHVSDGNKNGGGPPPRAKMAVVTFLVIWLQSRYLTQNTIMRWQSLSPTGKQALSVMLIVLMTTYVIMPVVTKYVLNWWLFPREDQPTWVQLLNCSWRVARVKKETKTSKQAQTLPSTDAAESA
jgi:hypothetical protein